MICKDHRTLSIRKQCELVGVSRSGLYYDSIQMSKENLKLMELIDEQYTKTPYYGSPKMRAFLRNQGYIVNIKQIKRLMRLMGISAVYTKPNTSIKGQGHHIYPYLLRGLAIKRPNHGVATSHTFEFRGALCIW